MPTPFPTAYLNGDFLPLAEARVSPLDRGFLFGDGVYEVIPTYAGRLFQLDEHLARLAYSLDAIRLVNPYADARWRDILNDLVARNGGGDQNVYLQVTRGAAAGRDHRFPAGAAPTVFAMSAPLAPIPAAALDDGIAAVTGEDIRWRRCDIKSISLLGNVLLRQQAEDAGAAETILLHGGHATEGSASTLFLVTGDGTLITPPRDNRLLPGITRALILDLARGDGIRCEERDVPAGELTTAAEIWLSSSTKEVLAVTRLDGHPVGDGKPGPLWRRVHELFQRYKQSRPAA